MDSFLLINGEWVSSADRATFERLNPLSGEPVTRAAAATVDDAVRAADAADAAFEGWAAIPPIERRRLLLRAADILRSKTAEFRALMVAEAGVMGAYADFNVALGADLLIEAAALTTQISGEVLPSNKPGTLSLAIRQPAGVCLGIAPWNSPIILAVRAIAMPLACGNTVILKASELTPGTHSLLGDVFAEAGFPAGVVNVITNAPKDAGQIGEALIGHPAVRRINFTGSTHVGRIIAGIAARYLKPVLLELGGKSPLIVLNDADLDGAVNAAIFGAFIFQGQVCMSTERLIVHSDVADEFVRRLAARASALKVGREEDGAVLGTLIDANAAQRIELLIKDAVDNGAQIVAGGRRDGTLYQATVLDHVTSAMKIYSEESFGPAKGVVRVSSDEEAVRIANDTNYGLSAAIFSRDVNRALAMAAKIRTGKCHINGPTVQDEAHIPFGGMKDSGYGRFGGKFSIQEFTELRWVTIEDPAQVYPF